MHRTDAEPSLARRVDATLSVMVTTRLGAVSLVPVRLVLTRLAVGPATVASVTTMPATPGARPVHPDEEHDDRDPKPIVSKKFHHVSVLSVVAWAAHRASAGATRRGLPTPGEPGLNYGAEVKEGAAHV